MHFESSLLGTIEFDDRSALTFVADLAGLEGCRRFQLCHDAGVEPNAPRVWWLQSLDQPDLTFSVTDPANLGVRYVLELSDEQAAALKLQRAEDAVVLVMVYKDVLAAAHPALAPLKANLVAPLVIDPVARTALQLTGLKADVCFSNRS